MSDIFKKEAKRTVKSLHKFNRLLEKHKMNPGDKLKCQCMFITATNDDADNRIEKYLGGCDVSLRIKKRKHIERMLEE